jgi:hypothetical protein
MMAHSTSDQARHDALLAEGRDALLAGDKARAQALLQAAIRLNPHSEEAWMWLSGTHAAPADMAACLQQVLTINPDNEHAQEGLVWLEAEHGPLSQLLPPAAPHDPVVSHPEPVVLRPRYAGQRSGSRLAEAALHPVAVGVLLGLLRLVGWLRPSTLVLLRGNAGPLGAGGALGVALTAALVHGLALLAIWFALGLQFGRLRVAGRGDRFDSLVRAGSVWLPGYLWGAALLLAALGLRLGGETWRVIAVLCWALLLGGAAQIGRRLWRLLVEVGVPQRKRTAVFARLLLVISVVGVIGLGLAGIVSAALLR